MARTTCRKHIARPRRLLSINGKKGDTDAWIYFGEDKSWLVGSFHAMKHRLGDSNPDKVWLVTDSSIAAGTLPDEIDRWFMHDGKDWVDDLNSVKGVRVTLMESEGSDSGSESESQESSPAAQGKKRSLEDGDQSPLPKKAKSAPELYEKAKQYLQSKSEIDEAAATELWKLALKDNFLDPSERETLRQIQARMKLAPGAERIFQTELARAKGPADNRAPAGTHVACDASSSSKACVPKGHKSLGESADNGEPEVAKEDDIVDDMWEGCERVQIAFSVEKYNMDLCATSAAQVLATLLVKGAGLDRFPELTKSVGNKMEAELRNETHRQTINIHKVDKDNLMLVVISIEKLITEKKMGFLPFMWCQKYEMRLQGFAQVLQADNQSAFKFLRNHVGRVANEALRELRSRLSRET